MISEHRDKGYVRLPAGTTSTLGLFLRSRLKSDVVMAFTFTSTNPAILQIESKTLTFTNPNSFTTQSVAVTTTPGSYGTARILAVVTRTGQDSVTIPVADVTVAISLQIELPSLLVNGTVPDYGVPIPINATLSGYLSQELWLDLYSSNYDISTVPDPIVFGVNLGAATDEQTESITITVNGPMPGTPNKEPVTINALVIKGEGSLNGTYIPDIGSLNWSQGAPTAIVTPNVTITGAW